MPHTRRLAAVLLCGLAFAPGPLATAETASVEAAPGAEVAPAAVAAEPAPA